jgi:transposase-like protein
MSRMLPGIETLEQYQAQLENDPDAYRPERCPRCGKAGLHHHGHYERNVPRGEGLALALSLLIILRFLCPGCGRTCSRLPACLSPRRQYWWRSQQAVLEGLSAGESMRAVARGMTPNRRTIGRWRHWIESEFDLHSLHLRSRFPGLGRAAGWQAFWSLCFQTLSLSAAMGWLDRMGVSVP